MQAVGEGYEFGGGCYRLNGFDDTPDTPTDGGGEGADCSGFTFKTWALPLSDRTGTTSGSTRRTSTALYSTWAYFDPAPAYPFRLISKTYSATAFMDALVERHSTWGHVALIHQEGSAGSDYIVHARNNTMGTELRYLPYRGDADFKAVAREDWTAECYPHVAPDRSVASERDGVSRAGATLPRAVDPSAPGLGRGLVGPPPVGGVRGGVWDRRLARRAPRRRFWRSTAQTRSWCSAPPSTTAIPRRSSPGGSITQLSSTSRAGRRRCWSSGRASPATGSPRPRLGAAT